MNCFVKISNRDDGLDYVEVSREECRAVVIARMLLAKAKEYIDLIVFGAKAS